MKASLTLLCNGVRCLRRVVPGLGAGVVDCRAGTGSVELRRYAKDHPFAQLQGSDNIIAFTTQRYASQPLIVRHAASAFIKPFQS